MDTWTGEESELGSAWPAMGLAARPSTSTTPVVSTNDGLPSEESLSSRLDKDKASLQAERVLELSSTSTEIPLCSAHRQAFFFLCLFVDCPAATFLSFRQEQVLLLDVSPPALPFVEVLEEPLELQEWLSPAFLVTELETTSQTCVDAVSPACELQSPSSEL